MKKFLLCALMVFCMTILHAHAQIEWDADKFMPLSEVKDGMQGTGYTVFFGTNAEAFEFEVVSIEYNYSPGWHVVWAEGTSENFKRTGVAGGMSGSPVYINNRLMGAISLGYFNQRERSNLFGITPIELMVNVAQRGMKPNQTYARGQFLDLGSEYVSEGLNMVPTLIPEGDSVLYRNPYENRNQPSNNTLDIQEYSSQLAIPVALPKLDPTTMHLLKPFFNRGNMVPVQAVGGGGPVKESPVERGQIIGTEVMRGDVTGFGFGTITYIDEQKKELLAYGHSAFGEGNVNLPLSGGYVHFIHPSRTRSSKVASPTQPIGTLVQDRVPAIAGLIEELPDSHHYIPVTAKLQTSDKKIHKLSYEAARDKTFTAIYASAGISGLVSAKEFSFNDNTVNVKTVITLEPHPELDNRKIVTDNIFSSSGSPGGNVSRTIQFPMLDLLINPFAKVRIESIDLDIKVEDKRKTAQILTARLDKLSYRPGDEIKLILTVRPYLEQTETMTATITIPKDTPEGIVLLRAMNASSYQSWKRSRAPGSFRPKNINQLVKLMRDGEPNTNLILEISAPQTGLTVQGEEFPNLPLSYMSVMNTAMRIGESGYTFSTAIHADRIETDYIITGSATMQVAVNRNAQ
ncbi:MAG: hypothetical protein OXD54_10390 [Candidatus Poribacteria bacterium]|nr:hypothetical protein [Candidatus Poribacteria bacterium]